MYVCMYIYKFKAIIQLHNQGFIENKVYIHKQWNIPSQMHVISMFLVIVPIPRPILAWLRYGSLTSNRR